MKLYSTKIFKKDSLLPKSEIENRLNELLTNGKYEGHWEDNCLFLSRVVLVPNKIVPDIRIEIIEKENLCMVNLECELKTRFKISSYIVFAILSIFDTLVCWTLIRDKTFNFLCFAPIIMGLFIYCIIYFSFSWESTRIKYDLFKLLK